VRVLPTQTAGLATTELKASFRQRAQSISVVRESSVSNSEFAKRAEITVPMGSSCCYDDEESYQPKFARILQKEL
jgi:hypothetical protein